MTKEDFKFFIYWIFMMTLMLLLLIPKGICYAGHLGNKAIDSLIDWLLFNIRTK